MTKNTINNKIHSISKTPTKKIQFKYIKNYPNYKIYTNREVRNTETTRRMKKTINGGYYKVSLRKNKKPPKYLFIVYLRGLLFQIRKI